MRDGICAYDKGTCPATVCDGLAVDFPAGGATVFGEPPAFRNGPPSWYGSIINGMTDGSGYQYKRNRYYDPATGQFTQEDPIGLAGGLNVYGYANGDPASYSDPFGLCPPADNNPYTCPGQMGAFVMLGQMAPAINHEVAWFLPRNLAIAAGGVAIEAGIGRAIAALRSWFTAGSAEEGTVLTSNISSKIARQMGRRGWTSADIDQTINSPYATRAATNRATGNSATAYFQEDGSYVVRDDVTGDIVQISNRNDPNWIPDASIQDPYQPKR